MKFLVARAASTIWVNALLKHRDAILGKVEDSVSFESFMELRNTSLSGSMELFPHGALETEAKSNKVSEAFKSDRSLRRSCILPSRVVGGNLGRIQNPSVLLLQDFFLF